MLLGKMARCTYRARKREVKKCVLNKIFINTLLIRWLLIGPLITVYIFPVMYLQYRTRVGPRGRDGKGGVRENERERDGVRDGEKEIE